MPIRRTTKVSSHRLTHIAKELELQSDSENAVNQALKAADLVQNDLNREDYTIDSHKEARFLQAAVEIVGDTSFAAFTGIDFVRNSAITAYVAKYSENLRDAIENARKYSVLTDVNSSYSLHASSNSVSFIVACSDPYLRHDQRHREFLIFACLATMRFVTARKFYPLEIRFEHSAPSTYETIQQLVGCPVVFNAEETEIILAPSTLNFLIPTYDPSLLRYLKGYGDGLLSEISEPTPDIRAQVEDLLVHNLPRRLLSANEIATNLGMGRRTLARRLAEKSISFSKIVDELRCELAVKYLRQSDIPLSEIAFLLDYSEQAGFTTAFKRWTGKTPKVFRKKHFAN